METKKNFVLDTNVILHDYRCIYNFQENDIYIPIVVLEELDKFKKGTDQINFNSREFARELDTLATADLFKKGVELGKGLGTLHVVMNDAYPEKLQKAFSEKIPDHKILAIALDLQEKDKKHKTILVSKDINLRMKAKALGIDCEDYKTDKVNNVDIFEQAQQEFDLPGDMVDRVFVGSGLPFIEVLEMQDKVVNNEYVILNSEKSSVLARLDPATTTLRPVKKQKCYGIEGRNAEQTFALDALMNDNLKLVAVTGKAGTGKTLLALAAALAQNKQYSQILLARPIVAMSNKDLGFLPGDEKAKISPYMQPLFDNLSVIKRQFGAQSKEATSIDDMQHSGQLVIEALAFIRGRSLNDTYFIIDEAQNLTPHEIKTIITRAGQNCKLVFTGDIQQIDTPYLDAQSNGLVYMIDKMRGQELFSHVNLVKGERSALSELASNLL